MIPLRLTRRLGQRCFRAAFWVRVLAIVASVQLWVLLLGKTGRGRSGPAEIGGGNRRRQIESAGWLVQKWYAVRRWWVTQMVLKERYYAPLTREEAESYLDNNARRVASIVDFEYSYPPPDAYAYVWYAVGPAEICSALTAMTTLRERRRSSSSSSSSDGDDDASPTKKLKGVDYLLLFLHTAEETEDDESGEEYQAAERLVNLWESKGGQAEDVEIFQAWVRSNKVSRRNRVKYHVFRLVGYTRYVLLDPYSFPVRDLDHLLDHRSNFFRSMKPHSVFAAPAAAGPLELTLSRPPSPEPPCFVARSAPVSTDLMVVMPSPQARERLFARMFARKKNSSSDEEKEEWRPWNDRQVVRFEFSCNEETHVLPAKYSQPDYTFFTNDPGRAPSSLLDSGIHSVHFSMSVKPWQDFYARRVLPAATAEFADFARKWKTKAAETCSFSRESDWFYRPEEDGSSSFPASEFGITLNEHVQVKEVFQAEGYSEDDEEEEEEGQYGGVRYRQSYYYRGVEAPLRHLPYV